MPQWNDANANLPDRETLFRQEIQGAFGGGTNPSLVSVLTVGNDAGGHKITNLANPTTGVDAATKAYVDAAALGGGSGGGVGIVTWNVAGTLTTQTGTSQIPVPAATIANVRIRAATAPTGASVIVDVNKNGTTIFTTQANRPTIAAAGHASGPASPDVTSLVEGDYLTVDIDQVGSTIAGADLVIALQFA